MLLLVLDSNSGMLKASAYHYHTLNTTNDDPEEKQQHLLSLSGFLHAASLQSQLSSGQSPACLLMSSSGSKHFVLVRASHKMVCAAVSTSCCLQSLSSVAHQLAARLALRTRSSSKVTNDLVHELPDLLLQQMCASEKTRWVFLADRPCVHARAAATTANVVSEVNTGNPKDSAGIADTTGSMKCFSCFTFGQRKQRELQQLADASPMVHQSAATRKYRLHGKLDNCMYEYPALLNALDHEAVHHAASPSADLDRGGDGAWHERSQCVLPLNATIRLAVMHLHSCIGIAPLESQQCITDVADGAVGRALEDAARLS